MQGKSAQAVYFGGSSREGPLRRCEGLKLVTAEGKAYFQSWGKGFKNVKDYLDRSTSESSECRVRATGACVQTGRAECSTISQPDGAC